MELGYQNIRKNLDLMIKLSEFLKEFELSHESFEVLVEEYREVRVKALLFDKIEEVLNEEYKEDMSKEEFFKKLVRVIQDEENEHWDS